MASQKMLRITKEENFISSIKHFRELFMSNTYAAADAAWLSLLLCLEAKPTILLCSFIEQYSFIL